ncbi:SulP family inorganic anion transporter [Nakamurella lactea]|uniref:SulP family inorganic anion transporter n=1 Tax=Nakamurella lactea TaxID=459515 RepID=UPI000418752A|nr:SulP family inorganic anion transporter [Nakamurella lactea]
MNAPVPAAPSTHRWLLPTLSGYQRGWLTGDVIAGLSAGAVVVPQAMAYATIANMPVQIGLYTCMVPMIVYAMLGGSRAMSVSTTSTIATLSATTLVSAGVAAGAEDAVGSLMALTLLVGVILLLGRLLRLGSIVEVINKSTIIGVQVGVGGTVAVGQLPKLLGETSDPTGKGFIRSIAAVVEAIPEGNLATICLSVGSVAVLFGVKAYLPKVPGPLVVVVAGILLVAFTSLTDHGVQKIAPIPFGFPVPKLPDFTHLAGLVPGALAIAVMAFLESAAVARGIRKPGETQIDSNQELFATAAANVAGSFFQTMPAAGGFSQSAVNQGAGARSQVSSLVTVALAVIVALFLAPVLSLLPQATLASMVFVAVVGLIDVRALARLKRISARDFWTALVTAAVGLTAGLLAAVAAGVLITFGLVLHELNRVRVTMGPRTAEALTVVVGGALYTANVQESERAIIAQVEQNQPLKAVVLEVSQVRQLSVTVLDALEDLDRELTALGVQLRLASVAPEAVAMASRTGWYQGLVENNRVFDTTEAALAGTPPSDRDQNSESRS